METWWADTKPLFAYRPSAVIVIGEGLVNLQPESSKFECAAGAAPPSFNPATIAGAACETPQTTRSIIDTAINGGCHLRGIIHCRFFIFQHRSQKQFADCFHTLAGPCGVLDWAEHYGHVF